MNRTEATNFLTSLFAATPAAAALIPAAIDAARVADPAGHGPADPGYVETVDEWLAAAEVADMLALQAAQVPTEALKQVTSEGTTLIVDTKGVDWYGLAALYRRRSPLTSGGAGIGVIDVVPDDDDGFVPRSTGVPW